jgi:uncharacterized protein YndB with AHSA1/START domain
METGTHTMSAAPPPPAVEQDTEVRLERIFDAPRAVVFGMWIDADHVSKWWGPRGFTNPLCEIDAQVGGAIRIDMRGPDGTVYPMTGTFRELVAPERLAFASTALDADATPLFETLITVVFDERDGRTTQTLTAEVLWLEPGAEHHASAIAVEWAQSLERLDAHISASRE